MIQINPNNIIRLELSNEEQETILAHCQALDHNIYIRIKGSHSGVLHLLKEDCDSFKASIEAAISTITPSTINGIHHQLILVKIYEKISPGISKKSPFEEIEGKNFDSMDHLNEHLQDVMVARNKTSDSEMGNLSPEQVSRLIYSPWDENDFPLKFNKELTLKDVKGSTFFTNTCFFLKALIENEKENTATATGNLTRKIVKILFDRLVFKEGKKEHILKYNKVINEEDVFELHIVRVVCEGAGLIHRRKNKFLVVKKHQNLLLEEKAGELYHLLFNGYFKKFNLGYVDRLPEADCIQQTISYSFYRLGEIAKKYINIKNLENKIFLPAVKDEVGAAISNYSEFEWIITSRILRPLKDLGLLECKYIHKKWSNEIDEIRKTQIF